MSATPVDWPRVIAHADMDAFYAAVEQHDDPSLRGKPLLVGANSARGVVLTASYEARPSGVGSAMPMQRARRLCPEALVVPPRFERYQEVSRVVMATLATFSPLVEPLSLDEAFVDMTGATRLFGAPRTIGARIKEAVREATGGLTVSVGLSGTRYVAKVASGFAKPDGLTVVPPHEAREWLAPQPVSNLWGAGAKTAARLRDLGFETIGQVACAAPEALSGLGAMGRRFVELANGRDARPVEVARRAVSIGSERTLHADISARGEIEAELRISAHAVAKRLRRRDVAARGVRIKLKRADFVLITRQELLAEPTDLGAVLHERAVELLAKIADRGPFRLVGVAAYDLEPRSPAGAMTLDFVHEPLERVRKLETTLDALAERFGTGVVQRAADLNRDRGVGPTANLDFLDDD
jgi:DNA polymerase-4